MKAFRVPPEHFVQLHKGTWHAGTSCAFFFQQALTTGSLQNFARKYNLAIDKCAWNFEVQAAKHAPEQPPDEGFFIRGLFMEGARWSSDKSKIEESMPKVIILFLSDSRHDLV